MTHRCRPIIAALLASTVITGAPSLADARSLADRLVAPDRAQMPSAQARDELLETLNVPARNIRFEGGPRQTYWLVPPLPFTVTGDFTRTGESFTFRFNLNIDTDAAPLARLPERGSVVLLHGWGADSSMLLPWAASLSAEGYRTVLVDLRNHGQSGSAPAGYGLREGQDIVHLIRHLRAQNELSRPLYLLGLSYGATTAIAAAAQLDGEIDGVIALAPFDDPTEAIGGMIESVTSDRSGLGRRVVAALARHRYTPERIDAAISEASERLNLDLRNLPIGDALARIKACSLLVHGVRDTIVPVQASRRLATRNVRAALVELPNDDHLTLAMRFGWLRQALVEWLVTAANGGDCPPLRVPPDPLAETTDD